MQRFKARLERLERRSETNFPPRIVLLNPGESVDHARARLGLGGERLAYRADERTIFVRWAG